MFLKKFITAIVFASIGVAVSAQTVTLNAMNVEGLVVGHRYILDADFSAEHNIPVPAPFEFIAPTSDDYNLYSLPAPGGTGIIKVFFVMENQETLSNLQFIPMTMTTNDPQEQIDGLKALLEQAFRASVPDINNAALDALRITEINGMRAMESIGRYDGGADGIVVLRIVAIPNPNGADGMIAIINAISKHYDMKSSEDVMEIEASRALGTFQFQ